MSSEVFLRDFPNANNGFHDAALAVAGVAVAIPAGASGGLISVSAGCYIGVRDSATLVAFSDANYGSILNGAPVKFIRALGLTDTTHIHLAPWSGTAAVAITFF